MPHTTPGITPPRRRHTDDERAAAAKKAIPLYVKRHKSIRYIADAIGWSYGSTRTLLLANKVTLRTRGGQTSRTRTARR